MSKLHSSGQKKKNKLNIIIAVLLAAILICSAFLGIKVWENHIGEFKPTGDNSDELDFSFEYDGVKYDLKEDVQTLLVLGLDKYEHYNDESYTNDMQADFIILLVIDNNEEKCTALHINRDTMAEMNVLGVAGDKVDVVYRQIALAHTYGNGKEISGHNAQQAVSNLLLGVEIDNYVSVTMESVSTYNDFVGGVELTVLDDFSGIDDTLIKGEKVTLFGDHALNYVRSRYGMSDSTNEHRMERQRQYLQALYDKTMECYETDDSFIVEAVSKISPYLVSDCSASRLQSLLEKIAEYELTEIENLEGESVIGEDFVEFYPDAKALDKMVLSLFYTPRS